VGAFFWERGVWNSMPTASRRPHVGRAHPMSAADSQQLAAETSGPYQESNAPAERRLREIKHLRANPIDG
jgi:hypothetical protein